MVVFDFDETLTLATFMPRSKTITTKVRMARFGTFAEVEDSKRHKPVFILKDLPSMKLNISIWDSFLAGAILVSERVSAKVDIM